MLWHMLTCQGAVTRLLSVVPLLRFAGCDFIVWMLTVGPSAEHVDGLCWL